MRNNKMNKSELIDSIAKTSGLTKTDSAKALDAFVSSVCSALKSGDDIRLVGFGTFSTSKRAATTAINPRTRQPVKVAARKVAKFKAGKTLQSVVNSKK
ncbi:MAG: HU family DNA-binding protein [Alphaproteobacteria bacterium]